MILIIWIWISNVQGISQIHNIYLYPGCPKSHYTFLINSKKLYKKLSLFIFFSINKGVIAVLLVRFIAMFHWLED